MIIALGQFAVSPIWQRNAEQCVDFMVQAERQKASLLVLPEAVLATDIGDPSCVIREAQALDGPFLHRLLAVSASQALVTVLTLHIPTHDGRVGNVLVVLREGKIIARYYKLHLYDAFSMQESANVDAGRELPPIIEIGDMPVGVMTCYDLRFPELAKSLALRGAELIVVPAAWVRGPHKERHWETLVTARALDTTCYVAAVSECGPRNIGCSMVADPLGVVVTRAAEMPELVFAELSRKRVNSVRETLPVLANSCFQPPILKL